MSAATKMRFESMRSARHVTGKGGAQIFATQRMGLISDMHYIELAVGYNEYQPAVKAAT